MWWSKAHQWEPMCMKENERRHNMTQQCAGLHRRCPSGHNLHPSEMGFFYPTFPGWELYQDTRIAWALMGNLHINRLMPY